MVQIIDAYCGRGSRSLPEPVVLSDPGKTTAERTHDLASGLYSRGYWCAESVVKAVNDVAGHPLPPEVMRMASGFCEGFGGSRCTCGALAGAVMAVGLFAGRTSPLDEWEPSYDAAGELKRRFVSSQDAASCDEIAARFGGMSAAERWAHCTWLVGSCAQWVVEIAQERGWL